MRVFTALIFLKNCFGNCYELNCVPLKFICWKSQTPVPQNVTLFGNKVFADVIKLRWGHTWTKCAPNPTQVVFYRKGKFGHRYTGGGGFPRGAGVKNLHTIAETQEMIDSSIPGLGRSARGENGNPPGHDWAYMQAHRRRRRWRDTARRWLATSQREAWNSSLTASEGTTLVTPWSWITLSRLWLKQFCCGHVLWQP